MELKQGRSLFHHDSSKLQDMLPKFPINTSQNASNCTSVTECAHITAKGDYFEGANID
jgi:hypothetical protein